MHSAPATRTKRRNATEAVLCLRDLARRIEALTRDGDRTYLVSLFCGFARAARATIRSRKRKPDEMSNLVPHLALAVSEIVDEMRRRPDRGKVASYIPELAGVDADAFGLVVIDADGNIAAGGDSDAPFSIQSISKVFTLTLALGKVGNRLWRRVGREPSGSPFNSIVQL